VIEDHELILIKLLFADHEVTGVRIRVHKSLLVDHLDNHVGEGFADEFEIDFGLSQSVDLIDMDTVDVLHDDDFPGGCEHDFWYVYVAESVVFEEGASPLHVLGLFDEI
jgi:hypothetical protein